MDPTPRGKESTALEQAVSRAVRDNLPLVQHTTKELGQAIEDFVAACGSTRNANMLPAMLRAQTAAASLTSMLDVLARLLTASLQPGRAGASEAYVAGMTAVETPAAEAVPAPRAAAPAYVAPEPVAPPPPPVVDIPEPEPEPVMAAPAAVVEPPPPVVEEPPPPPPSPVMEEPVVEAVRGPLVPAEPEPEPVHEHAAPAGGGAPLVPAEPEMAPPPAPEVAVAAAATTVFRVEDLPPDQQELHRRANRHAKVSMQDIYLLRPKDVKLARENKDICVRLRGDIEKARKEYVRRFGPILEHPVDYFYHWMVEVLAEGKPEILGEYPYPSAATRR